MHNSLGPLKGCRMLITGIGESVNGLAHLVGVRGAQAAQDGLGQDAEPYLHLVEPGGMGRRVMQIDRGVAGQPPVMPRWSYLTRGREQRRAGAIRTLRRSRRGQLRKGVGDRKAERPRKRPAPVDEGLPLPIHPSPLQTNGRRNDVGPLDLATIAGLAQWAGSGITRIGRKRIEAIVKICQMIGHLQPGLDEVLIELTHLVEGDAPVAQVTMRDCIGALVQLDSLLGQSGSSGAALLSLFLDDAEESTHR